MKKTIPNRISVFLLLASGGFFAAQGASSFFKDGNAEFEKENWYLASQHFLEAVNENSAYGEAWFRLAECSYMLGEYDLVLSQLSQAEKYLRDDSAVENLRGMTCIALERFSEARLIFEKILKNFPNNVDARFGLAELDLFDGKITGAEKQYGEALKREAYNRKALLSLAVVCAQTGRFDRAEHFINSAIGHYSGEAEVHYLAAVIYAMKGNVEACKRHSRIAVELNGNYDRAYELLSKALYMEKNYEEVISICDFRISKNRNLSSAWYLKGQAEFQSDRKDDAMETWSAGLRINPEDEVMRAALYLAVREGVPLEDPRRGEWAAYHVRLAREAEGRFDSSEMEWEYQRALKIQPSNKEARLRYANILELNGMRELYLEQLLFIRENRISPVDLDGGLEKTSSAAKKSFSEISMDDTIEAYGDLLQDSLAKKWKVQPFFLDKTRWRIGIYYTPSSVHLNHVEANKIAAEFAGDVFSGISSAAVESRTLPVSGFGEAYRDARNSGMDYFVILNQDEGSRDISLDYKFYSARTGYLLWENSLYGTGNSRHSLVFRRFRGEVLSRLPIMGKIISRSGRLVLADLGRSENVREGAVFDVVRKGAVETSGTSTGLSYKEDDILGTFTVTTAGEEVSEGVLEYRGFFDRVNLQDSLVLVSLPASETQNARDLSRIAGSDAPMEGAPGADASGESLDGKEISLDTRSLGIRRVPSFVEIIRSIY